MTTFKTVDEYLAKTPEAAQGMLEQIRRAIISAEPKAKEKISYNLPFYEYKYPGYNGRLAYFGAFKKHVSLFIVPRSVPFDISQQLKQYKVAKATLQFPLGTKVPVALIKSSLGYGQGKSTQGCKMFSPTLCWCNVRQATTGGIIGQVLHRCARTTEAVRRAIQHSQKSLNALAG